MGYMHKYKDMHYQIIERDDKFYSTVYHDPFLPHMCETKLCESIVEASTLVKLEIIRLQKFKPVENQPTN
jgi:hypothetical protein